MNSYGSRPLNETITQTRAVSRAYFPCVFRPNDIDLARLSNLTESFGRADSRIGGGSMLARHGSQIQVQAF